ncbi:hypothetical protein FZEAL_3946 [Fusarium zealandicum]|uniref:Uncharacterized protein n=1 Tax=Fusarium zealandicum TaxID=1053134 RepID=A0A8H4UNC3_9HYPO|nr:hypothetical protein FZEAL_3946 [Fusarium zealandicum]
MVSGTRPCEKALYEYGEAGISTRESEVRRPLMMDAAASRACIRPGPKAQAEEPEPEPEPDQRAAGTDVVAYRRQTGIDGQVASAALIMYDQRPQVRTWSDAHADDDAAVVPVSGSITRGLVSSRQGSDPERREISYLVLLVAEE